MNSNERLIEVSYGQDVDISNPNLIELITKGYKFDEALLNDEFIHWRGEVEYRYAHVVYFAKVNNIEVASLSIITRPNNPIDPFWTDLQAKRPRIIDPNLLAIYIQGIVVHPSMVNKGIASQLLETMTEYYQPEIIFGQTRTPEAVYVRSKVLTGLGYRSFYGISEVTPGDRVRGNFDGRDFIHAAFAAEGATPGDTGVYVVEPYVLPSYFPITDNFPSEIQRAFTPIQDIQQSLGPQKTAASVLVSVKPSGLDKSGR